MWNRKLKCSKCKKDITTMKNLTKTFSKYTCSGCGRIYGHHNTKVCTICQECSACHKKGHRCYEPRYVTADKFIKTVLK